MFIKQLIHWLEAHMLSCPVKSTTGFDCPGCGMQRSFIALMKGEFLESINLYPPLMPMLFMLLILIFVLRRNFRYRMHILYGSYAIVILTMIINFILKIN